MLVVEGALDRARVLVIQRTEGNWQGLNGHSMLAASALHGVLCCAVLVIARCIQCLIWGGA
jgi:hypothetical protein